MKFATYLGGLGSRSVGTPTSDAIGIGGAGYFGANFDIAPLASVPQPGSPTLAVLGAGVGGIGFGWRRWRRSAA